MASGDFSDSVLSLRLCNLCELRFIAFLNDYHNKFNFYYYEITNENIGSTFDKAIYKREEIFTDEFNFVSKT